MSSINNNSSLHPAVSYQNPNSNNLYSRFISPSNQEVKISSTKQAAIVADLIAEINSKQKGGLSDPKNVIPLQEFSKNSDVITLHTEQRAFNEGDDESFLRQSMNLKYSLSKGFEGTILCKNKDRLNRIPIKIDVDDSLLKLFKKMPLQDIQGYLINNASTQLAFSFPNNFNFIIRLKKEEEKKANISKLVNPQPASQSKEPNFITLHTEQRAFNEGDDTSFLRQAMNLKYSFSKGFEGTILCKSKEQLNRIPIKIDIDDSLLTLLKKMPLQDVQGYLINNVSTQLAFSFPNNFNFIIRLKPAFQQVVSPNISNQIIASNPFPKQSNVVQQPKPIFQNLQTILEIDNCGKDGDPGKDGRNGANRYGSSGSDGERGKEGTSGTDGKPISLQLSSQNEAVIASTENQKYFLALGNPATSISLKTNGGQGGKGGDGGYGGMGSSSLNYNVKGSAPYYHSPGRGGAGGTGGKGGDGGNIDLYVSPEETDLLMLVNHSAMGGRGGEEGSGGSGGIGIGPTKNKNGPFGPSSYSGNEGIKGKDGSCKIHVGNTTYYSPYDLEIIDCQLEDFNADGIIEPGEIVNASIKVKNKGGMPTPPNRKILFSLNNTQGVGWLLNPLNLTMQSSLAANNSLTFQNKLSFRVNQTPGKGSIGFKAVMENVNKAFKSIEAFKSSFITEYPLKMLTFKSSESIAYGTEGIFSFCIRNKSKKDFGAQANPRRIVSAAVRVDETKGNMKAKDIDFIGRNDWLTGGTGIEFGVNLIKLNEMHFFSGAFRINNNRFETYSKLHLVASLHFEQQDDPKIINCIQEMQCEVLCINQGLYEPNPNADFLIVTNAKTTQEEFAAWKAIAEQLKLSMCVWNIDLYGGISLFQSLNHHMLATDFEGKTIVFLDKTSITTRRLPTGEMFLAARDYGIRFYIVGNKIYEPYQFFPPLSDVNKIAEKTFNDLSHLKSFDLLSTDVTELHERVIQRFHECRKQDPRIGRLFIELFPNGNGSGHYKEYPSPRMDRTYFLNPGYDYTNTTTGNFIASYLNIYGLLKMFPFEKKLQMITSIPNNYKETLQQAILSDLADEQYLFAQDKWNGEWSKENFKNGGLILLNTFLAWDWAGNVNNELSQDLLKLILQFRAFIKRFPKADTISFFGRKRTLSDITKELIDAFIEQNFKMKKQDWNQLYLQYKEEFKEMNFETLWKKFRNPLNLNISSEFNLSIINQAKLIKEENTIKAEKIKLPIFETQEQRNAAYESFENTIYKNNISEEEKKFDSEKP
jgi:hypothetical protein